MVEDFRFFVALVNFDIVFDISHIAIAPRIMLRVARRMCCDVA